MFRILFPRRLPAQRIPRLAADAARRSAAAETIAKPPPAAPAVPQPKKEAERTKDTANSALAENAGKMEKVESQASRGVMMMKKKKKMMKLKKEGMEKLRNAEKLTEAPVQVKSVERREEAAAEKESLSTKEKASRAEAQNLKSTHTQEAKVTKTPQVKDIPHASKEGPAGEVRKAASASASASQEKSAAPNKTPMIKAFRIEDVLGACTANDGVFARRLPQGGCQFFAWPGTPLSVASNAVATMPDTIRTVHAVFGREKTPVDLVMDIDCPVPKEHWNMSRIQPFQKKLLDDVLSVVEAEIKAAGESIETQVVLQSPNLKKASFHVHTKLKDAAFADYHSLYGFLHRFREKIPNVDLQIYRPNGMLRMHRCMKENHTSSIVVFEDPRWNIGFPNGVVPDPIAALHSACIRESGTFSRLLRFELPRGPAAIAETAKSQETKARPVTILLPRTEREAVENASQWMREEMTEVDVGEWRAWIGVGINAYRIAYNFRDAQSLKRPAMEELLDAWVVASKKCPVKFRPGACEAKWASFDINKLRKSGENDWWSSYQRLGRIAQANAAPQKTKEEKKS